MQALIAVLAVVAGILLGFWIRTVSTKRELALLDQRNRESLDALAALQKQLMQSHAESAARAGFESLAAERAAVIAHGNAELAALRSEIESKSTHASSLSARISQLEADLNNERQNMAEKVALLETAKQALANQFQTLAADILDQKSKIVFRGQSKRIGHATHAAPRTN